MNNAMRFDRSRAGPLALRRRDGSKPRQGRSDVSVHPVFCRIGAWPGKVFPGIGMMLLSVVSAVAAT